MRFASLTAVIIVGVWLTGCGSIDQTASDIEVQKPTLAVTYDLLDTTASIKIETNLNLSPDHVGQARQAGEGHIHLSLDEGANKIVTSNHYVIENLSKGKHSVKVSLHNNDHTPYGIAESIQFEVK